MKWRQIRKISGHKISKKCGMEVEEGTEMRSVKSVMEHNDVGDQLGTSMWQRVQWEEVDFVGDAHVDR